MSAWSIPDPPRNSPQSTEAPAQLTVSSPWLFLISWGASSPLWMLSSFSLEKLLIGHRFHQVQWEPVTTEFCHSS
jgi:hypothetical protein